MKNIKTLLVITAILLSSIIYAQPPGGGQQRGQQGPPPIPNEKQIKEMVSDLSKEISFTEEQEASVLKLYIKHYEDIKNKTSGNSKPKREEMETLKNTFEKEVKALLTEEQQKQFMEYQKKNVPKQERQQRPNK